MGTSTPSAVAAVAAVAACAWLLWHDGTWDTYRMPLFWPFVFATVMITVFSNSPAGEDRGEWKRVTLRLALTSAVAVTLAAQLSATNPINDLGAVDIVSLQACVALLTAAGGLAASIAHDYGARGWRAAAWCLAACLLVMRLVPPLIVTAHGFSAS
jgi:hypothetical protein